MGIPVVAPRMPNLQDLIDDGVDGVLFEPENVDDLASVLGMLVSNVDLRKALGQRGRATVTGSRTWRHNAHRIISVVTNSSL